MLVKKLVCLNVCSCERSGSVSVVVVEVKDIVWRVFAGVL